MGHGKLLRTRSIGQSWMGVLRAIKLHFLFCAFPSPARRLVLLKRLVDPRNQQEMHGQKGVRRRMGVLLSYSKPGGMSSSSSNGWKTVSGFAQCYGSLAPS